MVATEDTVGEKRLVGYIVAEPGERPSVNELREFLKRSLPDSWCLAVLSRSMSSP